MLEPLDRSPEVAAALVDHEIDSAATADSLIPVEEFCSSDGEDPLGGVPLLTVVLVPLGSEASEHVLERDGPDTVDRGPGVAEAHRLSFGLKLTQFFMLMTWLFSVRRSIRAAVR